LLRRALFSRRQQFQNDRVPAAVKLAHGLAKAPGFCKAEARVQGRACLVFAVNPRSDRVTPPAARFLHSWAEQTLARLLPVPVWGDTHKVFHGEAIPAAGIKRAQSALPGSRLRQIKRGIAANTGDADGIALLRPAYDRPAAQKLFAG